jgi:hypothetical protein
MTKEEFLKLDYDTSPSAEEMDTILQEKGNLHLYEKMGYHRTGKVEHINDRMDIVFYEKD